MVTPPGAHWRRITSGQIACLAGGIGIYTIFFTTLAVLRYRAFYSYEWTDLAGINQVMWSAVHGGWFLQSVTDQYFMGHFQPILALLCIPYFIVPRVTTLFFLVALAIALGAVPVFLLARRVLSPRVGILWAWAYLLYSPLHNITLTDFRPVVFCIPCLLAALYVFERKRFGWFCVWCVAAVFCQENIGLCVAFLGLYALWRRRSVKWVLMPILLGTLWFALCTRVIMPMLFGDVMYPFGGYLYLWIGDKGAGALIAKILKNPLQFAALALSPSRVPFLLKCFWPLCFLPFISPIVMLVPAASWFQLLMVQHSALHAVRIHWLAPMVPTFFFAAIMGARKLLWITRRSRWRRRVRIKALVVAPLVTSALSGLGPNSLAQTSGSRPTHNPRVAYVTSLYDPVLYTMEDEDRAAWRAIATVPSSASVAASADLMPALSHRRTLYELGFRLRYRDGRERDYLDVDYVVVHARCESFNVGVYDWPGIVQLRERTLKMLGSGEWEPVFMEGNFLVLRRVPVGKAPRTLPHQTIAAVAHVKAHWSDEVAQGRAGGLSDLARTAYELGDLEKALECYSAQAAVSPHDPYPCRKAGEALRELGRFSESLSYLRTASERSPLCFATSLAYAKVLLGARHLEAAEREYRRAIRLLPTHAEPHVGLGMAHMAKGNMAAAARAFRRAVKLDPSYRLARDLWERCR